MAAAKMFAKATVAVLAGAVAVCKSNARSAPPAFLANPPAHATAALDSRTIHSILSRQLSPSSVPEACQSTCSSTFTIYDACMNGDVNTCLTACSPSTYSELVRIDLLPHPLIEKLISRSDASSVFSTRPPVSRNPRLTKSTTLSPSSRVSVPRPARPFPPPRSLPGPGPRLPAVLPDLTRAPSPLSPRLPSLPLPVD